MSLITPMLAYFPGSTKLLRVGNISRDIAENASKYTSMGDARKVSALLE